jgi:hypothetical protein
MANCFEVLLFFFLYRVGVDNSVKPRDLILSRGKDFSSPLRPDQSPNQWVLGTKRPEHEMAIHLHLVLRTGKHGDLHALSLFAFMARCLGTRMTLTFISKEYCHLESYSIFITSCLGRKMLQISQ